MRTQQKTLRQRTLQKHGEVWWVTVVCVGVEKASSYEGNTKLYEAMVKMSEKIKVNEHWLIMQAINEHTGLNTDHHSWGGQWEEGLHHQSPPPPPLSSLLWSLWGLFSYHSNMKWLI